MKQNRVLVSVGTLLLITLIYFAAGKIGLKLAFVHASASAVWPPTGIALGALLLFGNRVWPAVLVGAFLVNITTAGNVATSLGIALGNTLEGLLGASLVGRFANGRYAFNRVRDVFRFTVLAAMVATTVSATFGVTSLALSGFASWTDFEAIWRTWWLGDAVGALLVTPVLVTWAMNPRLSWTRRQTTEVIVLLAGLVVAGGMVFGGLVPLDGKAYPLLFVAMPIVVWIAFRFSQRETATAIFILGALANWGTLQGVGAFAMESPHESLLFLQAFLGVIAVMSMTLTAAMAEHREMAQRLDAQQATARILAEAPSSSDPLSPILETICEKLQWEMGNFWRVNTSANWIECVEIWASPAVRDRAAEFIAASQRSKFTAGIGMPGRAWQSRGVVWIDDVVHDANFPRAPFAQKAGLHSAFAFPVLVGGSVFGILEFFTREFRSSKSELLAMMAAVGSQIGHFIERGRAAVEIERQRAAAEAANCAKDNFLAVLSHELRTPLTPIVAAVHELESTFASSADGKAALAMIRRNVEVETRLIDDLLDVTRVVNSKLELQSEPLDAHHVILDVIELCRSEVRAKHLEVHTALTAKQHFVNADRTKLQQIIWNLVKNAVKFSRDGGAIWMSTANEWPGAVTLCVRDNGIGIDAELLPRVFDPFEQGERQIQRRYGGLGLGLAIAKGLADAHGGTLTAASAGLEQGATFSLSLAVVENPPKPAKSEPSSTVNRRPLPHSITILLVDDHDDTRVALARLLRGRGYDVEAASDVRSALSLAENRRFDLLVSDIGLPDGSGLELMQQLQVQQSIRGIALSGFGMVGDVQKSKACGFAEHLLKPVDFEILDGVIRRISFES